MGDRIMTRKKKAKPKRARTPRGEARNPFHWKIPKDCKAVVKFECKTWNL